MIATLKDVRAAAKCYITAEGWMLCAIGCPTLAAYTKAGWWTKRRFYSQYCGLVRSFFIW